MARFDRGQVGQPLGGVVRCGRVDRLDRDECGQRQAEGVRIDPCGVPDQDSPLLQPAHPLMRGRHRQAHLLGEVGVAQPAINAQQPHDLPIELLHAPRRYRDRVGGHARGRTSAGAGSDGGMSALGWGGSAE